MAEKSKRSPSGFDFCPKHHVFFVSCGCKWEKKQKKEQVETIEEIKPGDEEK